MTALRDDPDALLGPVRAAWRDVLQEDFDGGLSWEEIGGDSLGIMHVLLRLEDKLHRKLSYDLFRPDMTVHQFARALATAPARNDGGAVPTMFLAPGLFGDEPILAEFRRPFAGTLNFRLVDHPGADAPRAMLVDTAATGAHAAREIARRQPEGAILLAGYSYGGRVAFEAAHSLKAAGRTISCLVILDSTFDGSRSAERARPPLSLVVRSLLRLGRTDRMRRWVLSAVRAGQSGRLVRLERHYLRRFRTRDNLPWRPTPLADVPVLLVLTEDSSDGTERRWRELCTAPRVIRVPAKHRTLFKPEFLPTVVPAIQDMARRLPANA